MPIPNFLIANIRNVVHFNLPKTLEGGFPVLHLAGFAN